jgi:hypothetical protein
MEGLNLYLKSEGQLILPGDFFLPFGGKLSEDNRWVFACRNLSLVQGGREIREVVQENYEGPKSGSCTRSAWGPDHSFIDYFLFFNGLQGMAEVGQFLLTFSCTCPVKITVLFRF